MKKQITSIIVLVLLLSFSGNRLYAGTYSGGMGEPNNPYRISTVADWQELMAASGDWNKYFRLTADIDLAGVSLTPIGNYGPDDFAGVFDGSGHVIRNATIKDYRDRGGGLFGNVGSGGKIWNLGVEDVNVIGVDAGGVAGFNSGSITSCYSTGTVSGGISAYANVGGLVGKNRGSITLCYSMGTVVGGGYDYVGGLVGINDGWIHSGSITSCYSTATVVGGGSDYVGGLVGQNNGSVISCYSSGEVSGGEDAYYYEEIRAYVGGLVGQNHGNVTSSHSTGTVSGGISAYVGGLAGQSGGSVTSSYSTGAVSGGINTYVGGLVGRNDYGHVTSCYSTGSVDGRIHVGGLVGSDQDGSIAYCYSTGAVNGYAYVGGLFGSLGGSVGSSVISCYATGSVSGTGIYVGGLGGYNGGSVTSCYATGSVNGGSYVGGLVGGNGGDLTSCYATASVSGDENVGGLIGGNWSSATSCYATGSVNGSSAVGGLVGGNWHKWFPWQGSITSCYSTGEVRGIDSVGSLVGINDGGSVTVSFWDTNTSGCITSTGGTGKTTQEMKTQSTFTDAGWDFVNVWKIKENIEYPHLIWENAKPVACIAGGNQAAEAQDFHGAKFTLDGSCSSDADSTPGTNDDINDFNWYRFTPEDSNKIFLGSGEVLDCNLPLGQNTIVLEVIDKTCTTDSNEITVTVQDTTPPEFTLSVTPMVLWPANHKMVKIAPTWTVSDDGDSSPEVSLVGITCNDKNAANDDIRINNDGSIYLRAEKGRIYTITYKACDESGNCTSQSATVTVPHDKGK